MKTNYEAPQIEVIEIEIEDAVLAASSGSISSSDASISGVSNGGNAW